VQHAKDPPSGEKLEKADIHLIGWEWEEVGVFITFAIFVFAVGYAKVGASHLHLFQLNFNNKLFLNSLSPHTLFGGLFSRIFVSPFLYHSHYMFILFLQFNASARSSSRLCHVVSARHKITTDLFKYISKFSGIPNAARYGQ
jgi:hypothetical protein